MKFFPAEACGGVKMLKAICAPYAHLGIKFMPTGGITAKNMTDYLSFGSVIAVGGTWICSGELVKAQNWEGIENLVIEALAILRKDVK